MSDDLERMKKKSMLLSYYSQNGNISNGETAPSSMLSSSVVSQLQSKDPYDINSTSFEPDLYLKRLIKVK